MSLFLCRRTDHLNGRGRLSRPELDDSLCASYLEAAEKSRKTIPEEMSFEEIIKNVTSPPRSLNDFMDYLVEVGHGAECLQFFLWYCGYVERWCALPREQRDLAPMWRHNHHHIDDDAKQRKQHARTRSFPENMERFSRIFTILEKKPKDDGSSDTARATGKTTSTNFSRPRILSPGIILEKKEEQDEKKDEPSDNKPCPSPPSSSQTPTQPFRDEIFRVVHQYIFAGGERQLRLTPQDRTACIRAVEQTTHPSALLPAFAAAEAMLRGRCHPAFVRWSASNNGGGPRRAFSALLSPGPRNFTMAIQKRINAGGGTA